MEKGCLETVGAAVMNQDEVDSVLPLKIQILKPEGPLSYDTEQAKQKVYDKPWKISDSNNGQQDRDEKDTNVITNMANKYMDGSVDNRNNLINVKIGNIDNIDISLNIDTSNKNSHDEINENVNVNNVISNNVSKCNRCKKDFSQIGTKSFKMCEQCRISQRQRSRRWQRRTKQKDGVCTRCATILPVESKKYVLCQHCRDMLRSRKANRYLEGKCVHCSGPNDEEGIYKVCKRCRERDRLRRLTLENAGFCNRCSQKLDDDQKQHKICFNCRLKKKRSNTINNTDLSVQEPKIVRDIEIDQLFSDNKQQIKKQKRGNMRPKSNIPDIKPPFISDTNEIININKSVNNCHSNGNDNEDILNKPNTVIKENTNTEVYSLIKGNDDKHRFDDLDDINMDDSQNSTAEMDRLKKEIESYNNNILIEGTDNDKSIEDHILLSEAFGLHDHQNENGQDQDQDQDQDHSQLNQQLKQLSQFANQQNNNTLDDVDMNVDVNVNDNVGKYDDNDSVLVDLDNLGDIEINYGIDEHVNNMNKSNSENGNVDDEDDDDDDEEDEAEKAAMIRHVHAVQAGLTLNSTEPSDADIVAAVAALAASVGNDRDNKIDD